MPATIAKRQMRATPGPSTELVTALKTLADTNRLRIIDLLRRGEVCVCEMTDALGLPQNLVSHHLRVLREVGLVNARREANDSRWVFYSLNPRMLSILRGELGRLLDPDRIETRIPDCSTALRPDGESPSRCCE